MKGSKLFLPLVVLIMSTAVLAIPWPGSTGYLHAASPTRNTTPSTSENAVSSMIIPPQVAAAAAAYWTPARMRAAIAADGNWEATGTPSLRSKYPFPFKRFAVKTSLYTQFPYSTIGKVFFTDRRTGQISVCSGTVVNSDNLSVVDTAGHCVIEGKSGNNWYTNWIFCPAYRDGTCPLGRWTARLLWSHSNWITRGYWEYDYGEAVMYTNRGSTLVGRIGGMGTAWNASRNQFFYALGYPSAPPFNGERMFECQARYATDLSPNRVSPAAIGIGCDMTGGASGGGWLIKTGNKWYVNGHTDFSPQSQPSALYSPYYGNAWFFIFDRAQKS